VRGTQKVGSACTSSRTRPSWTEELEIYIRSLDLRRWVDNGILGLWWSTWSVPIERYPRMASIMFRTNMLGSLIPHNRCTMLERVYHMEIEQSLDLKKKYKKINHTSKYVSPKTGRRSLTSSFGQSCPARGSVQPPANPCVTSVSRSIVHFSARRLN
jgi:hypothetical protein